MPWQPLTDQQDAVLYFICSSLGGTSHCLELVIMRVNVAAVGNLRYEPLS